MTTADYAMARIERLLRVRGYPAMTPQEREMLEDLMSLGRPCTDGYLLDAVSVGRWAEDC